MAGVDVSRITTGVPILHPQIFSFSGLWEFGKQTSAAMLDEALSVATEARTLFFYPEVLRTKGKLLFLQDPDHPETAQACFQQAVTMDREQDARSFELRAAMSLARLWRNQGKVQQARELLAPVYGWFTEGFDTLDLKEAKALLAELA